jgi:exodeoxyribonuclease III
MKIATFNINNIHKRLPNLIRWMAVSQPDVVCLQELKTERLPVDALRTAGYGCSFVGQRMWNGVAILARGCEPVITRRTLPGDEADTQARYIEGAVHGVLIGCIYAPNGNPQPGPKFDYKLAWSERLLAHAADLLSAGVPAALVGDYNIVPTSADMYPSRASYRSNALVQPGPRRQFERLLQAGWTDALRAVCPEGPLWTFWDYLREAWPHDRGLRLDHLLLSPSLAARLSDAGVDRFARGESNASDHAPAWIRLAD